MIAIQSLSSRQGVSDHVLPRLAQQARTNISADRKRSGFIQKSNGQMKCITQ